MRRILEEVTLPHCRFEQAWPWGIGGHLMTKDRTEVGEIADTVEVAPAVGQIVKIGSRRRPKYFIRRT